MSSTRPRKGSPVALEADRYVTEDFILVDGPSVPSASAIADTTGSAGVELLRVGSGIGITQVHGTSRAGIRVIKRVEVRVRVRARAGWEAEHASGDGAAETDVIETLLAFRRVTDGIKARSIRRIFRVKGFFRAVDGGKRDLRFRLASLRLVLREVRGSNGH